MNKQVERTEPSRVKAILDKSLGDTESGTEPLAPNAADTTGEQHEEVKASPAPVRDETQASEKVDGEEENETSFRSPFDKSEGEPKAKEEKPEGDLDDYDKETEKKIEEMDKAPNPGTAFRKVRLENKELKAELESYKSGEVQPDKVAELQSKADLSKQLANENAELQARLAEVDYRFSNEYKDTIERPLSEIAELAATLDSRNGLDEETILEAIALSNYEAQSQAVADLKDKVDPRSHNTISQMADQVLTIYRREDAIKSNAKELMDSSRDRAEQLAKVESAKKAEEYRNNVSSTFDSYQDKIPLFIGDDGEVNQTFQTLKSQASDLSFDEMSMDDKAFAALSSVSIGPLIRSYHELSKEVTSLRMSNGNSDRSTPRPPESDNPGGLGGGDAKVSDGDFSSFIKKQLDKSSFRA